MLATMSMQKPSAKSLRNVVMPAEHGGWGFLGEPMLAGLLLAPSRPGVWLCVAALGAFLVRRPFALAVLDLRKGHRYPRTDLAVVLTIVLGLVAAAAAYTGLVTARGPAWLALLLAAPFALVFLYHDLARNARTLSGELGGALAMGGLAAAVMLAGGHDLATALTVWSLLGARSLGSILLVRTQVRRLHNRPSSYTPAVAAHVLFLVATAAAALSGWLPWLVVGGFALMLARALRALRVAPTSAKEVGWSELRLSLAFILLMVVGYLL